MWNRLLALSVVLCSAGGVCAEVAMRDLSMDRPLVLDQNVDYHLTNVTITGLSDCAAVTLAGRIGSVLMERCTFGRIYAGSDGKAAGLECAGAAVNRFVATDTTFFDAQNQLACLKDGTFGKVTFERCRFSTSAEFLKRVYSENPWRSWPPMTEFYHIDRLELLDNEFSNTLVVIHPSVKQVVLRGEVPGLHIISQEATQVVHLTPDQRPEAIAPPPVAVAQVKGPKEASR